MTITSIGDRLWAKVAEREGGCWVWQGAKSAGGYGQIWSRETRTRVYAHRVAYELMVADIPTGLVIDHLCRNRACVNPDHLEPVPMSVNTARGQLGATLKAKAAQSDTCGAGHPRGLDNDAVYSGIRNCRTCCAARARAYRARKRAA